MTPEKSKRPLPRLYAGSQRPSLTPFQRWRASLREVRAIFDKAQYKKCATRCEILLDSRQEPPHPTHAAALHFLMAMCNEIVAKAQSNLAPSKLPLLNSARSSYLTALSLLPQPEKLSPQFADADDWSDSASCYSVQSNSSILPQTPDFGPSDADGGDPFFAQSRLPIVSTAAAADDADKPAPLFSPAPFYRSPLAEPVPAPVDPKLEAKERYNTHLEDFRELLDRHHTDVIGLIVAAMDAQSRRYSMSRSMVMDERGKDGEDDDLKAAQLRERIKKLKANGWKWERFNSSRTEELCERALADL